MAVRPILEYPDPRLSTSSAPVTMFDAELQRLVDDLLETLYAAGGIGLSAPQIGDLRRVAVMDVSGEASAPQVYVNPEVQSRSAWGLVEESCLSVPGVVANVIRATKVRVRAQDPAGESFEREVEAMNAVCVQHELDHLNGKLFIDHLSPFRRWRIRSRLKAAARAADERRDVA